MGGKPSRVIIKYEDAEQRFTRQETKQYHDAFHSVTQSSGMGSGRVGNGEGARFMNSKAQVLNHINY